MPTGCLSNNELPWQICFRHCYTESLKAHFVFKLEPTSSSASRRSKILLLEQTSVIEFQPNRFVVNRERFHVRFYFVNLSRNTTPNVWAPVLDMFMNGAINMTTYAFLQQNGAFIRYIHPNVTVEIMVMGSAYVSWRADRVSNYGIEQVNFAHLLPYMQCYGANMLEKNQQRRRHKDCKRTKVWGG